MSNNLADELLRGMQILQEHIDENVRIHDDDVSLIEELLTAPSAMTIGLMDVVIAEHSQKQMSHEMGLVLGMYTEAVYLLGWDRGQQEMFVRLDNKDVPGE